MRRLSQLSFAITLGFLASSAFAAGEHAGGHGHGHGHGHASASAIGKPGDPEKITRTVMIFMTDEMRFDPPRIAVNEGETIRLKVRNMGHMTHELVLGSQAELIEHAELMKRFPGMEHEEPNMVRLDAGGVAEIVWQFDHAGTVDFACLIPGHFEAGMRGKIRVEKP